MSEHDDHPHGHGIQRRHIVGGAVVISLGLAGGEWIAHHREELQGDSPSEGSGGPAGDSELSRLSEVDPALVHYEVTRSIDLSIREAHAMTVRADGGMVFAGVRSVITDRDGAVATVLDSAGRSRAVTCAADDTIWLANSREVSHYDSRGSRLGDWPLPINDALVTAIATSGDSVYLADAHHRLILQCDHVGRLIRRFGGKSAESPGAPGFVIPSPYFDIKLDSDGSLWAANPGRHQLEHYTAFGRYLGAWGDASGAIGGFCGCCNPVSFAMLSDGRFITAEKGIARVKRYDRDGRFDCVVAPPAMFTKELTGGRTLICQGKALIAATGPDDDVRVFDPGPSQLYVFNEKRNA